MLNAMFRPRVVTLMLLLSTIAVRAEPVALKLTDLEILGFRAGGSNTLVDVTKALGPAPQRLTGDAALSATTICYDFGDGPDGIRVAFVSSEEFSDPPGQINSILVRRQRDRFSDMPECARSSIPADKVSLRNGIRLDMSRDQVVAIIGHHRSGKDGSLNFRFERRKKTPSGEDQLDSAFLRLQFRSDRLTRIETSGNHSL